MVAENEVAQVTEQMENLAVKRDEPEEDVGPCTIVEGPEASEFAKAYDAKEMKAIIKEGGKKGVEIEGAADMGGLKFFCTIFDKPEGQVELLVETMKACNAKSDPTEEERKGGAGKIGKIVLSCTHDALALVAYVPSDLSEQCNAKAWLEHTINMICDGEKNAALVATLSACGSVDTANWYKAQVGKNADKNLFPMKMRDNAITHAYDYLKKRGLFPDGTDDDDEDDYVFGDDDFP